MTLSHLAEEGIFKNIVKNILILIFLKRDGPAFSIDSDLNKGHTYKSETYENFPFNGCYDDSKFQCLDLELFVVD